MELSVFLGQGDGRLIASQSMLAGALPSAVSVADVNRDGAPDVVVADLSSAAILVLLHRNEGFDRAR